MQIVGNELERLALSNSNLDDSDLLGRSAFNRYYYAAFLITRETLGLMQANWRGTAHAEIPNLLQEGLRKPARSAIRKQKQSGLLDSGDESRILTDLNATGSELAQLLRNAYDARILADYEPDIKTSRDGNIIMLKSHTLTSAKEWPRRASKQCARLLKIWKEVGLA